MFAPAAWEPSVEQARLTAGAPRVGAEHIQRWLMASGKSLVTLASTLFGLLILTFIVGHALPIDPVLAVVGERASPAAYAQAKVAMGLDKPLLTQFGTYFLHVLHGDLGTSVATGHPVIQDLATFFPATIELATASMALGIVLGVPAGILSAVYRNRLPDYLIRVGGVISYSMPVFWLGLMALTLFYADLGWTSGPGRLDTAFRFLIEPITGSVLIDSLLSGSMDAFLNATSHLVLPAGVLGLHTASYLARMARSFMIEALAGEYIIAARMKGLSEFNVVCRHALANMSLPLITTIALAYLYSLEGAVMVETVFAWPGIGMYVTQSLFSADLPAVLGSTTFIGICFVFFNTAVDALSPRLDPRTSKA
ncbi:ABC transporter permease [Burkholderia cepacia]|uniref:ABC transporter permease n=1 Tax=Burkholderia cepacia TaxID=292 RepID=UPI00285E5FE7|nr:ABC transporter permease [Burkholderia cepacia]